MITVLTKIMPSNLACQFGLSNGSWIIIFLIFNFVQLFFKYCKTKWNKNIKFEEYDLRKLKNR